jgi:hypothetical protein
MHSNQSLFNSLDMHILYNAKVIANRRPGCSYKYTSIKDSSSAHPTLSEMLAHLAASSALRQKIMEEEHALNQALIASVKAEFGL